MIIKNHNDDAGYYSSKFGLPVPNSPYGLCGRKTTLNSNSRTSKLRSCVKVTVDVLSFPSLIVRTVSVDSKQHRIQRYRAQELHESRGGRPGLPVPDNSHGLCGRKATLNCSISELRSCKKVEVNVLVSPSLIVLVVSVDVRQH